MSDRLCASPTATPCRRRQVADRSRRRPPVGPAEQEPEAGEEDRDLPRLAEVPRDDVLERDADQPRGDRRRDDDPRDPLVRRRDRATTERPEPRDDERLQIAPEVGPHRDERPEVQRDVERLVEGVVRLEVLPLEEPRNEDQVARGRDGQKLRRALDEAEHERLPVRELLGVVPHSEHREQHGERERRAGRRVHDGAAHARMVVRARLRQPWQRSSANCALRPREALDPAAARCRLAVHRARSASRSKPVTEALRGSGRSTRQVDESATGSVNLFVAAVPGSVPAGD